MKPITAEMTIIIATLNRESPLVETLKSVLESRKRVDFSIEIIVVDQTEKHSLETKNYLQSISAQIQLFQVPFKSVAKARNFGLEKSASSIVLFLDDDVNLWPETLNRHWDAFKNPQICAVTGPALLVGQKLITPSLNEKLIHRFDYDRTGFSQFLIGCNMSYRKNVFREFGMFDINFTGVAIAEESELASRLLRGGKKIWYDTRAGLTHFEEKSGGCRDLRGFKYAYHYGKSGVYFLLRIRPPVLHYPKTVLKLFRNVCLNRQVLVTVQFIPLFFGVIIGGFAALFLTPKIEFLDAHEFTQTEKYRLKEA